MKKKIFYRCLLGAPLGLAISTLMTIVISAILGDGGYHAVVPELVRDCGGELHAVTLQAACSLLYGAAWAGASAVWDAEKWSLLRMTVVHLIVCSAATFPVAYFMYWMEHSASGVLLYFGIFLAIYAVVWLSQYALMKKKIAAINRKMGNSAAR
ncbi:MAG: DUF3021 domain-containing protein [Clostridia bacterium]|nr:DUF3021 domain-containing protein [Clostridia bacterium]